MKSSNIKMESSNINTGAAGLWARNLSHPSFQGTLSPVIKQEPVTRPLTSLQQMRRFHVPTLITNGEEFVCSICEMFVIEEQGVVLKSCRHSFCRDCLLDTINISKTPQVPCPMKIEACGKEIRDEEVQALLSPEDYQKFLEKCFNTIANECHQKEDMALKLLQLESLSSYEYVENQEVFECAICLTEIQPGDGLMLKNCLHEYCKTCLARTIELSDELEVPCPFVAEDGKHCEGFLQDCELRSLITEAVYTAHLAKSLARAEAVIQNSIHCKTPDCPGWAEVCDGAVIFLCPLCKKNNCIKCKAIHEGKTCVEYFYETNADARKTRDDVLTESQLKQLIRMKEAMPCPGCGVVIQKTVGCNHMTCSRCKREFQWLGLT